MLQYPLYSLPISKRKLGMETIVDIKIQTSYSVTDTP